MVFLESPSSPSPAREGDSAASSPPPPPPPSPEDALLPSPPGTYTHVVFLEAPRSPSPAPEGCLHRHHHRRQKMRGCSPRYIHRPGPTRIGFSRKPWIGSRRLRQALGWRRFYLIMRSTKPPPPPPQPHTRSCRGNYARLLLKTFWGNWDTLPTGHYCVKQLLRKLPPFYRLQVLLDSDFIEALFADLFENC